MISSFFKIFFRNINKHKGYSFINIFGLAVGMTCSLLIMLWVLDELSYDKFHVHADNLYRIEQDQNYSGRNYHVNVSPYPMAEGAKAEIPEIKYASPFANTVKRTAGLARFPTHTATSYFPSGTSARKRSDAGSLTQSTVRSSTPST